MCARSLNMLELCVLTSENETEIDITDDTVEEIAAGERRSLRPRGRRTL